MVEAGSMSRARLRFDMHPFLTAYERLRGLREIEPRPGGLYWPIWHGMYLEQLEFIRELEGHDRSQRAT